MKNRDLQHFGDIGRVNRRARFGWRSRETDLIINDNMERPANRVSRKLRKIERFLNHAFARKSRVAVNEQRQAARALGVAVAVLLGARASHRDRIDKLQMTGVETKRQFDALAALGFPLVGVTEVIFDIAAARVQLGVFVFKFGENAARTLADDVR